ncbi:MAG TPA: hypothetical protein P5219_06955, partial [Aminivibrio sp.]|nr:hypothetical protein [Aminivibrio sp.]
AMGRPKDALKAYYWFDESAKNGFIDAMVNLGVLYEKGDGAVFSREKAFQWYSKAAEKGSSLGMAYLGEVYYQGRASRRMRKRVSASWSRRLGRTSHTPSGCSIKSTL